MADFVLNFRRGLYYSRFFFLCRTGKPLDVFGFLRRELPNGLWTVHYRFRYYADQKTFGSDDEKSFYSGEFRSDLGEATVAERVTRAFDIIASGMDLEVDVTVVGSDDPDVIWNAIRQKPYFHAEMDPSGVKQ